MIPSAPGIQQGDPAGPALFALVVDAIAKSVTCPINIWYLDDATLGGPVDMVCRDLEVIIPKLAEAGLHLNRTNCEVITTPRVDLQPLNSILTEYKLLLPDKATLLGAPLSSEASSSVAEEKLQALTLMSQRLRDVEPHCALFLFKNCLWLPKVMYFIRASPAYQNSSAILRRMDALLRETMSATVNVNFREDFWSQASLTVRHGGLGFRRLSHVAFPTFLASLYASADLV